MPSAPPLTLPSAENVQDASKTVPLALMAALATNAILALLVVVTIAFTIGDFGEVLATATVQPFVALLLDRTGSEGATIAMTVLFILCLFAALVGEVATASRQVWSFARVGGLPFSQRLQSVRYFLPVQACSSCQQPANIQKVTDNEYPDMAVKWTVALAGLVTFINLFPAAGFNAIISLILVTMLLSYTTAIASAIFRRVHGPGLPPTRRFSLGRAGLPINIIALLFQLTAAVFSV
jgi:amino acid transporter